MNTRPEPGILSSLWPHLLRVVIGGVFLYSGYIKIIDPASFAKNVFQYQLLPDTWINITAMMLPWLELICGSALILAPRFRRGAAAWITIMLVIFTSAIAISLYRGLDITCGCFSTDPNAAKIGWKKIIENLLLLAMSAVVFWQAGKHPSLKKG